MKQKQRSYEHKVHSSFTIHSNKTTACTNHVLFCLFFSIIYMEGIPFIKGGLLISFKEVSI